VLTQPYSGRWRIICQEPCDIQDALDEEENHPGTLWNVSVAGAYVAMPKPWAEPGRQVKLSFCLPGELTMIQVTARVAWVNHAPRAKKVAGERSPTLPPGCGLEFINLAQIDRTRITARVQGT
jgi:PilZ domain